MTTTDTTWPYDADQHDPLTALRIPVTSAFPGWRYTATFDRESEQRPTDLEATQLASFIEQYKRHWFNDRYIAKLNERPFDTDAVTKIFHKWADGDWSYRVDTWQYGPFWVPVAPWQRSGENGDTSRLGPLALVQVMDRTHGIGTDYPSKHWMDWKAQYPEVFPA